MPPEYRGGLELSGVVTTADRLIFAEGNPARCFYKVVSGVVRICQFLSDGRRRIDAFYMAGDVFGFEPGDDHTMNAEAVSDCVLVAYRRRGLETMLVENDRLGRWFFAHAMSCIAVARERALLLACGSASERIAGFLLEMASRQGSETIVELAMSRQDIADYLGLTIETVSRTFARLERDGIIKLPTPRRIILADRRALPALLC